MRKVNLTVNEEQKYLIVKQFVDNDKRNYKHLCSKLCCCLKTAYTLVKKYEENGKEGFSHKNHSNKPSTTISSDISNKILEIYTQISKSTKVNFRHFRLILERDFQIKVSYTFIRNLLSSNNFLSPKAQRKTKSAYRKRIKSKQDNNKKLTTIEKLVISNELIEDRYAHPYKERTKYFGELIQMDASEHKWFGNIKTQLHAAIDDCSGKIIGAYFDTQETLNGYYQITKQFLENYGIPARILTDNRTVFNYIKNGKGSEERDTFTQYGFMCHRLGIDLRTSSIPQVKGRVERLFETLQSRLITELSLKGIETISEANEFLPTFINDFNKEFSLPYNNTINAFVKPENNIDFNEYLACVFYRVVNGNSIKYNKKHWRFVMDNGKQVFPRSKQKCIVIKKFNGELVAMINESIYHLEEIETYKDDSILEPVKERKQSQYKPGLTHPWKKEFYDDYINFWRKNLQNNYAYNC